MAEMSKRDRLAAAIAGESVDRTPVALWRHFPGDDQRPEDLAAATVLFQQRWDWDFVKVTPASSFCVRDWGVQDRWVGNTEGTREYTVRAIESAEDWKKLDVLAPQGGSLGNQLRCLEKIKAELGNDIPIIQTIFSPLAQAKNLAGNERLLVHLRRHPEAVRAGLETVCETTRRFVRLALQTGIDGIFYAVQHARYGFMDEVDYAEFGRKYDLRIFEELDGGGAWLNVLHLHGDDVMFDLLTDYPVHVWNWHDQETPPSLVDGKAQVQGAVLGGLRQWETLMRGDPSQVRKEARAALAQTAGRSFILGTGCVVPIAAPWSNLQAAREIVEPG